jgi:DNA-binding transcriptional LysR family regulator
MDPAQLQLLALIDRHGSMSGAAHALGRTPAAITQQVAKAERDLQTPLVLRGPRGATLTAAGALLAQRGRVIDDETQKATDDLAALLGRLSLRLRIGAFQAAALYLLPPALTALRHLYPEADLTVSAVRSHRGVEEVAAGRFDMAVVASWDAPLTPPDHLTAHPLLQDPMVVVLPDDHPTLAGPCAPSTVDLEQLSNEAWVTIVAGHAARTQFDRVTAAAGFTPKIRFQTESYDVAQALVGTGIGVALVSRLALTQVPQTAHRALRPPSPHRQLYAITLTDTSLTPMVAVFLQLLLDVASDLEANWQTPIS